MDGTIWRSFRRSVAVVVCSLFLVALAPTADAQEPRLFVDLQPGEQPTDGAIATVRLIQSGDATLASLHITAIRDRFEGIALRAHLHKGDCINFGTRVDQAMLDVTLGADTSIRTVARIEQVLTPAEARVLVVYDQDSGTPWACVEIPWPAQDMLQAQAREAATDQAQILGLALTGSDWPGRLAVVGGSLVLGGLLFLGTASFSRRIEEGAN